MISPLSKFDILGQAIWKESLASGLVGFSANQTDKKVACFEIAMSGSRGKSFKLQSGTKPEMRPTNFAILPSPLVCSTGKGRAISKKIYALELGLG